MIKSHGFIFSANTGTDVTHFFGLSLKWVNVGRIIVEFQCGILIVAPRAGFVLFCQNPNPTSSGSRPGV